MYEKFVKEPSFFVNFYSKSLILINLFDPVGAAISLKSWILLVKLKCSHFCNDFCDVIFDVLHVPMVRFRHDFLGCTAHRRLVQVIYIAFLNPCIEQRGSPAESHRFRNALPRPLTVYVLPKDATEKAKSHTLYLIRVSIG